MVAPVAYPDATPTLRVVPAMPAFDDDRPPTPLRPARVKNTIRCQTEFCKLELVYVTADRSYTTPQYVSPPTYRLAEGVPTLTVTCPNCGTVRTIRLH